MLDSVQHSTSPLLDEVLASLSQTQKTLPAKLFYDDEGCRLFGEITRLPEYYVTRTERDLLKQIVPNLPVLPGCALVEYGGSDEGKALMVLEQIGAAVYVPIDIAAGALQVLTDRLEQTRPDLLVTALPPAGRSRASQVRLLPGLHHRQPRSNRSASLPATGSLDTWTDGKVPGRC